MIILILDYGSGNLKSVYNSVLTTLDNNNVKPNILVSNKLQDIKRSDKIILPGVGSFDTAIKFLHEKPNMLKVLERKVLIEKIPILGVCLGMQLFTNNSEEGILPGLGWIEGETKKFPKLTNLKVPHMGWSYIKKNNEGAKIFKELFS